MRRRMHHRKRILALSAYREACACEVRKVCIMSAARPMSSLLTRPAGVEFGQHVLNSAAGIEFGQQLSNLPAGVEFGQQVLISASRC